MSDTEATKADDEPFICDLEACPECGASWIYEVRDRVTREFKHFSRLDSVYSREQDRTIAWECPDCKTQWKRNARRAAVVEPEGENP